MVCIVDEPGKIEAFLPSLERMVDEGLIAISDVDVIRYSCRTEQHGE
jgi:PII-like signaling protein